jgi:sulfate transport system permease protein
LPARLFSAAVTCAAMAYLLAIVGLPVGTLFYEAFAEGWDAFVAALRDENTQHALWLTVKVCAIVVPINTLFGLAAAWVLARQRFVGHGALAAFVNLPMALAPTIAGLLIVLVYSPTLGLLAGPVEASGWQIVFAPPAMVIATLLVTLPLVALELLPTLEQLEVAEEQAAITLGANAWQTFFRVILPAVRWSLVYGIVLCTAKAAGEFGAVSAVSGKTIGETMTLTLHVEQAYTDYETVKAYASSTVLTLLSVGTLILHLILPSQHRSAPATNE